MVVFYALIICYFRIFPSSHNMLLFDKSFPHSVLPLWTIFSWLNSFWFRLSFTCVFTGGHRAADEVSFLVHISKGIRPVKN